MDTEAVDFISGNGIHLVDGVRNLPRESYTIGDLYAEAEKLEEAALAHELLILQVHQANTVMTKRVVLSKCWRIWYRFRNWVEK